jgi:hypothetical protein
MKMTSKPVVDLLVTSSPPRSALTYVLTLIYSYYILFRNYLLSFIQMPELFWLDFIQSSYEEYLIFFFLEVLLVAYIISGLSTHRCNIQPTALHI